MVPGWSAAHEYPRSAPNLSLMRQRCVRSGRPLVQFVRLYLFVLLFNIPPLAVMIIHLQIGSKTERWKARLGTIRIQEKKKKSIKPQACRSSPSALENDVSTQSGTCSMLVCNSRNRSAWLYSLFSGLRDAKIQTADQFSVCAPLCLSLRASPALPLLASPSSQEYLKGHLKINSRVLNYTDDTDTATPVLLLSINSQSPQLIITVLFYY